MPHLWRFLIITTLILPIYFCDPISRPNIIIMVADDLGYGDLGCYGNGSVRTPEIDRLAQEGVKLTQHLAAASVCTPSRAALLTGRYPIRTGMAPIGIMKVIMYPSSSGGLPGSEVTFAELVKPIGYKTGFIGKWHLGDDSEVYGDHEHHPLNQGFDYFYGLLGTNQEDFGEDTTPVLVRYRPYVYWELIAVWAVTVVSVWCLYKESVLGPVVCVFIVLFWSVPCILFYLSSSNLKLLCSIMHRNYEVVEQPIRLAGLSQRLVNEGIEFMDNATKSKSPFLLVMSWSHMHVYLDTAEEFKGRSQFGKYGDVLEELDWSVGAILNHVDKIGARDHTMVYFTSDNGGHLEIGNNGGFNGALKGGKTHGAPDGGIRVPGLVRWPNVIPSNSVSDEQTSLMDVLPMVATATGTRAPTDRVIDGRDMLPLLQQRVNVSPHTFLFHYCGDKLHAVRYRPREGGTTWKFVTHVPPLFPGTDMCRFVCNCNDARQLSTPLLYDLTSDPVEGHPISSESAVYRTVSAVINKAIDDHRNSIEPVESQFSWAKLAPNYRRQPCCNGTFPFNCYCTDPKYPATETGSAKDIFTVGIGTVNDGHGEDPWILCTNEPPDDQRLYPTIGNGHVATVVHSNKTFMNGLYNGNDTESMRARIPAVMAVNVTATSPAYTERRLYLNMSAGMYVEEYRGDNWSVQLKMYAHRTLTRLLVTSLTISVGHALETDMRIELGVTSGQLDSDALDVHAEDSDVPNSKYFYGVAKVPETPTSERVAVHVYYSIVPANVTVPAHTASTVTHVFLASHSPTKEEARRYFLKGRSKSKNVTVNNRLEDEHIEGWQDVWLSGRVDVLGNRTLAGATYSALYYLLSAIPTQIETTWPFIGLSPGDLGHGDIPDIEYGGHVFWDQETWMYPTLLALHTTLGKTIINTRIRTLDAAYQYARQRGYEGAMYPWESAFTGLNVSPGGRWAKYEQHITADVALAARQYLMISNDTAMLNTGRLAEAIVGMADFWKSRVVYNQAMDRYEIHDVMPPDEFQWPVNNSAYTNAAARLSLLLPKFAYSLIGRKALPVYEEIAEKMYIPLDDEIHYHPEFDGFVTNITVKQADVVLLGYPLMIPMDRLVRANDLTIYEKLTPAGPAMTWSMFAIGWLELGETDRAAHMFHRQLLNLQPPFNVWTEYSDGTGAANFITGMGGYLQSILFGYGGLRIYPDHIDLNCLPLPGTEGFVIVGLDYLGRSLDIVCDEDNLTVTLTRGPLLHMVVTASGKRKKLAKNKTITIARQKVEIFSGAAKIKVHTSKLWVLILLCLNFQSSR